MAKTTKKPAVEERLKEAKAMASAHGWGTEDAGSFAYRAHGPTENDEPDADTIAFARDSVRKMRVAFPGLVFHVEAIDEWVDLIITAPKEAA